MGRKELWAEGAASEKFLVGMSARLSTRKEAGVLGVNERGGELGEMKTQRILYIFYQNT